MILWDVLDEQEIEPRGVVHVGAHRGGEVADYYLAGLTPIVLVEPLPELAEHCRRQWPQATVIEAAAGCEPGTALLYVPKAGTQWASIYRPRKPVQGTLTVPMVALADVVGPEVNILVADVQGAELDVVDGADLGHLDLVVLETSDRPRYENAPLHGDVVDHMRDLGWRPARVEPHPRVEGVFDAAFVPEAA